jgi:hypothetical protein
MNFGLNGNWGGGGGLQQFITEKPITYRTILIRLSAFLNTVEASKYYHVGADSMKHIYLLITIALSLTHILESNKGMCLRI